MTTPPRRAAAPWALVRNLPIVTSVAAKHLDRGGVAVSSALLRGLPPRVRRGVAPVLARLAPTLGALEQAASGREADAVTTLGSIAREKSGDAALRAVDGLTVLHRTREARACLDELRGRLDDASGVALSEARLLAEEGHLTRALEVVGHAPPSRAGARLTSAIAGELSALDAASRISASPALPRHRTVDPSRVLHLVTTALPDAQTGYTIRTQGIASALAAAGLTVDVVSRLGFPVDSGTLTATGHVQVDNVSYRRLLPSRTLPLGAGARLDQTISLVTDLVADLGPDLLHAHSMHGNAQVALAVGRATGLPVVYEVRGFLEETWRTRGGDLASDRYRLSREAETACMRAADAVVTLSGSMADEIRGRGVERVHVIPNAVPDTHLADPPDRDAARAALGIPGDAILLGFSGTVNEYEGLSLLVEALGLSDDPRLRLLVVGSGPALSPTKALASGLGDRVTFTGRVPHAEVLAMLPALDLYCVPRLSTPVTRLVPPLKPIEALAVGVPVLASDLPPLAELAAEGPFVDLAPAGDAQGWRDGIARLAADRVALQTNGAIGREWACLNRTWSRLAEEYRVIYSEATQGRRGPGKGASDRSQA